LPDRAAAQTVLPAVAGATGDPKVTLVIATRGRTWQLERLLLSLRAQTFREFEVIVVSQNPSGSLAPLLEHSWPFPLSCIETPDERGVSVARNRGWRAARGAIVQFPDDDCWFPPEFLAVGVRRLEASRSDLLSGITVNRQGRPINGRFAQAACPITRRGVWTRQMEGITFIRRDLLVRMGGYNPLIGIGAPTPWQAAEGPDFIFRALTAGARCRFDPGVFGFHREIATSDLNPELVDKLCSYARGMGFVLRRNGNGLDTALYWSARPLFNALRHLLSGQFVQARCQIRICAGRWQGYFDAAP
jgi:glycosyltransferase involved in cell wall biosynthesis